MEVEGGTRREFGGAHGQQGRQVLQPMQEQLASSFVLGNNVQCETPEL